MSDKNAETMLRAVVTEKEDLKNSGSVTGGANGIKVFSPESLDYTQMTKSGE